MLRGLLLLILMLLAAGCRRDVGFVEKTVPDGDVSAGREALIVYDCGACHMIPGIPDADAYVGPPLNKYEQRHYIAGNLPNTADNLIDWIQNPQAIEPGTAMPALGVSESEARNIAAYLYSES